MKDTERPGAETALAALRIASSFDPAEEDITIRYGTARWNDETREMEEVEPYYVATLDCSDTFFWGTSDFEEVTAENLHILEEVIAELKPRYDEAWRRVRGPEGEALKAERTAAYDQWKMAHPNERDEHGNTPNWGKSAEFKALAQRDIHPHRFAPVGDLFAARVRGMRPQGAAYKVRYDESLWELFHACGPERETGFGNPKEPGQ